MGVHPFVAERETLALHGQKQLVSQTLALHSVSVDILRLVVSKTFALHSLLADPLRVVPPGIAVTGTVSARHGHHALTSPTVVQSVDMPQRIMTRLLLPRANRKTCHKCRGFLLMRLSA